MHPTIAGWGNFANDRWELYHTDKDPTETHDLAAEHPTKLQELINLWFHEAGSRGLPLEDRTAVEVLADPTRPQVAPPRDQYVYYPGAAEVPETAAANIRNRSYSIAVEVDIESEDAAGVLFSHGRPFRRPRPATSRTASSSTSTTSSAATSRWSSPPGSVPTGQVLLSAAFVKEGDAMPTTGTLSLFINDEKVGEGRS